MLEKSSANPKPTIASGDKVLGENKNIEKTYTKAGDLLAQNLLLRITVGVGFPICYKELEKQGLLDF